MIQTKINFTINRLKVEEVLPLQPAGPTHPDLQAFLSHKLYL
jgi:hypothetical protein